MTGMFPPSPPENCLLRAWGEAPPDGEGPQLTNTRAHKAPKGWGTRRCPQRTDKGTRQPHGVRQSLQHTNGGRPGAKERANRGVRQSPQRTNTEGPGRG